MQSVLMAETIVLVLFVKVLICIPELLELLIKIMVNLRHGEVKELRAEEPETRERASAAMFSFPCL